MQQIAEEKEREEQYKKEQAIEGTADIDENKKEEINQKRYVQYNNSSSELII